MIAQGCRAFGKRAGAAQAQARAQAGAGDASRLRRRAGRRAQGQGGAGRLPALGAARLSRMDCGSEAGGDARQAHRHRGRMAQRGQAPPLEIRKLLRALSAPSHSSPAHPRSPSSLPLPGTRAPSAFTVSPSCCLSQPSQSGHQLPLCSVAPATKSSSVAAGLVVGPILVFLRRRRVDHAGDMPRPGQHEPLRPGEMVHDLPHALRRRDMVLAAGLDIGRRFHPLDVDRRPATLIPPFSASLFPL